MHHFLIPTIGEIKITVSSNRKAPQLQDITIISLAPPPKYYVLLYEANQKSDWFYFVRQSYNVDCQKVASIFLPKVSMNYILLEGNKTNSTFTFQIQSKYPVNYVLRKQSCFNIIYIVPYKIYPFPEFYYCTTSTLHIDALN